MATWKKVITTADDTNYKNSEVTVSDLGGGSGTTQFLRKDGTWAVPPDDVSTADVVSALNADLTGDITFGTQADDTVEFSGNVWVKQDFKFQERDGGTISITRIQDSGTAFVDNDTDLMTAGAIDDRILDYGYSTTTGTITTVRFKCDQKINPSYSENVAVTSGYADFEFQGGVGITTAGNDNDDTIAISFACPDSLKNVDLEVGRDSDNFIDFGTDNEIHFKTNGETPVIKMKATGALEATSLVLTGHLTVGGTMTAINTTNLEVADKQIIIASNASPTATTGHTSGIMVETSATEGFCPTITWYKDEGGGNTDGTGTANGLSGWYVRNMRTSNTIETPISTMEFGTSASGNSQGVGSFYFNTNDNSLYIRTA